MRTVVISDTHGKDCKSLYDEIIHIYEDYDEKGELQRLDNIIFLGDYMDNRYINPDLQIKRLLDLFELKACDDRIHILVGNHDVKYLDYKKGEYKDKMSKQIQIDETVQIYNEHLMDLEYAFFDGKYMYSHTGISQQFLDAVGIKKGFDSPIEVCNHLNKMLTAKMYKELFYCVDGLKYRHCVKDNNPDYNQFNNLFSSYWRDNQVVGHYASSGTQVKKGILVLENEEHGNYLLLES